MEDFFVGTLGWSLPLFKWLILPLVIFMARLSDVSIATVRIMFVMNGKRKTATLLGFCESFIWLMAIGQIFRYIDNPLYYVAYAGGYASGTYMGMLIESKIAFGKVIVRVITRQDASALIGHLKQSSFGLTNVQAEGKTGAVNLLFSVIDRKQVKHFIDLVEQYHPNAFYTIEATRFVKESPWPEEA